VSADAVAGSGSREQQPQPCRGVTAKGERCAVRQVSNRRLLQATGARTRRDAMTVTPPQSWMLSSQTTRSTTG
jgi:hypothetical protein